MQQGDRIFSHSQKNSRDFYFRLNKAKKSWGGEVRWRGEIKSSKERKTLVIYAEVVILFVWVLCC